MTVKKILSQNKSENKSLDNFTGEKVFAAIYDTFKDRFTNLFPNGDINLAQENEKNAIRMLDTMVQNLSFRLPAEHAEMVNSDRKNGLKQFYEKIKDKYEEPEIARKVFLESATNIYKTDVFTAHPTETLTNRDISIERKISEIMHSNESVDWISNGFDPKHPVVQKLGDQLTKLYLNLSTDIPTTNLRIDQEFVRGIKHSERPHDAIELMLYDVSKTLKEVDGAGLTKEETKTHFVQKEGEPDLKQVSAMKLWVDRDGKYNQRPYFTEEKLFETAERAMDQLFMVQLSKANNQIFASNAPFEVRSEAKNEIKDVIKDLVLRNDSQAELQEFYSKTPQERNDVLRNEKDGGKHFWDIESPNIARHIQRLKQAKGKDGIDQNVVNLIEESVHEIVNSKQVEQSKLPQDYKFALIDKIDGMEEKYGEFMPKHKAINNYEMDSNALMPLMVQVSNRGTRALECQLRLNSADVEGSLVHVLKSLETEQKIELPEVYKTLINKFDNRKELAGNNVEEFELGLSKDISAALKDMQGNDKIREGFRNYIKSRDADMHVPVEDVEEIAKSLTEKRNMSVKDLVADIKAYDTVKSIKLAVDYPEKITEMITAESNIKVTVPANHLIALAVSEDGVVKNSIFPLPESVRTIQNAPKDWAVLLEDDYIVNQIKQGAARPAPKKFDDKGNAVALTTGDMMSFAGFDEKDISDKYKAQKIEASQISMWPQSDVVKVASAVAAPMLIAQSSYGVMKAFAEKGIYLEAFKGGGSSSYRGNPVDADMKTIQGRDARKSSEAYHLENVARKVKLGEMIVLSDSPERTKSFADKAKEDPSSIYDKDPRFNYANNDWGNYKAITQQKEKWDKYYDKFVNKVGGKYAELYESKDFGKWFTADSLQEPSKLVSYSARAVVKTGDKVTNDPYPAKIDVDKMRAIQYGMASSSLIPHGGMMIHHAFEDEKGALNYKDLNEALSDYRKGEIPALQETINKSANMLAISDLRSTWRLTGNRRQGKALEGYIRLDTEKLKIADIATGSHDEQIETHLRKSDMYKHIDDKNVYDQKIADEVVAIRKLAQMDHDVVASREYVAAVMNAVSKDAINILPQDIQQLQKKDSKDVIIEALPHLQKVETELVNEKRRGAYSQLAEVHNDIKNGKEEAPKRKASGEISNEPAYEKMVYNMQILYETTERVATGILRPEHAKSVELEQFQEKQANRSQAL